jgi:Ni/Co efflux regulator RcnB
MRKLIFALMATAILSAPMTLAVRADDTTVIKRDNDGDRSTTVIKKRDDVNVLPVPHVEEKKTIIKKEGE